MVCVKFLAHSRSITAFCDRCKETPPPFVKSSEHPLVLVTGKAVTSGLGPQKATHHQCLSALVPSQTAGPGREPQ